MTDIPRNPTEWTVHTWAWVFIVIAFGGIYNWLVKVRATRNKPFSIVSLLGELALCESVGIPVFMALHGGTELAVGLTVAIAIAAGHYGTRFICKLEAFANAYACKAAGLSPDELEKFEALSSGRPDLRGCFDFGCAFSLLKQGEALRHVLWPKNQWVSMPQSEGIPVRASDLWSKANADFARRQEDQTVLVLPSISLKLATGEIVNGWTPSVTDLLVPGWVLCDTSADKHKHNQEDSDEHATTT